MSQSITKIKKEMEIKFTDLRLKRKNITTKFKKKLEEEKINQIKNSILGK